MATLVGTKLLLNEKETEEKSEFYERLIREAPFIYGDHAIGPDKNIIPWLDIELIKQGQEFVRRNFFSVLFSHFIAAMLSFSFKSARAVLLRTGYSHQKKYSITRYLSTVLHVKQWYETDFTPAGTKTAQDVYGVRKMHGAAPRIYLNNPVPEIILDSKQKKLLDALISSVAGTPDTGAPLKILTNEPVVPMSQFDMVIIQFGFLGFIVLYPQMWGIWDTQGINGFIHMWAVLGRLLGIEDRFNLALHFKDRKGYYQIWKNIVIFEFKDADGFAVVMWDCLIYGLRHYAICIRLNTVIYFMLHDVALVDAKRAEPLMAIMTCYERYCYFMTLRLIYLLKWSPFRIITNQLLRFSVFYARVVYMRGGVHTGEPGGSYA